MSEALHVDMEKGEVLWAESLGKSNAPDGDNFLKFIEKVLKNLPSAGQVR